QRRWRATPGTSSPKAAHHQGITQSLRLLPESTGEGQLFVLPMTAAPILLADSPRYGRRSHAFESPGSLSLPAGRWKTVVSVAVRCVGAQCYRLNLVSWILIA